MPTPPSDPDRGGPTLRPAAKLVWVAIMAALIVVHMRFRHLTVDQVTLGLLLLAALPWLLEVGTRFKVGDFEVDLRGLERQVDRQQATIEHQQRQINELVRYAMSASVFRHLCGIALLRRYDYSHGAAFQRELYFLRDAGYIMPRGGGGFVDFDGGLDGRNLAQIAEPTPIGWTCIAFRREDVPADWLDDEHRDNLRLDPATLPASPGG